MKNSFLGTYFTVTFGGRLSWRIPKFISQCHMDCCVFVCSLLLVNISWCYFLCWSLKSILKIVIQQPHKHFFLKIYNKNIRFLMRWLPGRLSMKLSVVQFSKFLLMHFFVFGLTCKDDLFFVTYPLDDWSWY